MHIRQEIITDLIETLQNALDGTCDRPAAELVLSKARQWTGHPKHTHGEYVNKARELYQKDCLEVDGDAKLSPVCEGDLTGAWVQAWVWVYDGSF